MFRKINFSCSKLIVMSLTILILSCVTQYKYKWFPEEQRNIPEGVEILNTYIHLSCGHETQMSREIAETLYIKPDFYDPLTYCAYCKRHFHFSEFEWSNTGQNMFEWYQKRKEELTKGMNSYE